MPKLSDSDGFLGNGFGGFWLKCIFWSLEAFEWKFDGTSKDTEPLLRVCQCFLTQILGLRALLFFRLFVEGVSL